MILICKRDKISATILFVSLVLLQATIFNNANAVIISSLESNAVGQNQISGLSNRYVTLDAYQAFLADLKKHTGSVFSSVEKESPAGPRRALQDLNPQPEPPLAFGLPDWVPPGMPIVNCETTQLPPITVEPPNPEVPATTQTESPVTSSSETQAPVTQPTQTESQTTETTNTEAPETEVPTEEPIPPITSSSESTQAPSESTETSAPTTQAEQTTMETTEPVITEAPVPPETTTSEATFETTESTFTPAPITSEQIGTTTETFTMAPTASPSETEVPTPSETSQSPEPTVFGPYGCEIFDVNGVCSQCNLFSWLNTADNTCNCFFNYRVEAQQVIPVQNENETSSATTYNLSIYTQLRLNQSLYSENIACTDLLLFIFEDQNTLQSLAPEVDYVKCELYQIFYIVPPTGNNSYLNVLTISNMSENVFQAFLNDKIEMAYDYNDVDLECWGAPELLVTYQGLNCSEVQTYCYNNQSANNNSNNQNTSTVEFSLGSNNQGQGICNQNFNLIIINDQNLIDIGSPYSLQIDLQGADYNGTYLQDNVTANEVDCADLVYINSINTDTDWVNLFFTQDLLQCTAQMIAADDNVNISDQNNTSNISQQYLEIKINNLQEQILQGLNKQDFSLNLNLSNLYFYDCSQDQTLPVAIYSDNNKTVIIPVQSNQSNNFSNESVAPVTKNCTLNCTECDENTGQCSKCDEGFILIPSENDTYTCLENPCSSGTVYDLNSSSCISCPDNCSSCDSANVCKDCEFGYYKLYSRYNIGRNVRYLGGPFQCVAQCPLDMFTDYDRGRCLTCDPECSQCLNNPNYQCFWPFQEAFCSNKQSQGQNQTSKGQLRCVNNCPAGYYQKSGWCVACLSSNCKECKDFDTCTKCEPYYSLVNGTCQLKICESYQYLTQRGQCANCSNNCTSCSINQNNCTACDVGYIVQSGQCIESNASNTSLGQTQCNQGFFYNQEQQRCNRCSPYCNSCKSSDTCDSCSSLSYSLYNQTSGGVKCVSFCPKGYYTSNAGKICKPCLTSNCDVCSPEQTCWTCSPGYYKGRTSCFQSCQLGQYLSQDSLKYYQCYNCSATCTNCTSRQTCNECADPFIKIASQFSDISDSQVQQAVRQTCVQNSASCPNGTFYSQDRNQCILCPRGCAVCNANGICTKYCSNSSICEDCISTPTSCIKCPQNQILVQNGNNVSCAEKCSEFGQFYDKEFLNCKNCSDNCQQCDNQNECNRCQAGFYKLTINESQQCVEQCPEGYYGNNQTRQCQKCSKNCLSCQSATNCTLCDIQTSLDTKTRKCYCALRYTAYLSGQSDQVQVSFQNVNWNPSVSEHFSNPDQIFNCSAIFDFNEVNSTIAANPPYDNSSNAVENLKCTAVYLPDANSAQIVIYNVSQTLQTLIGMRLVTIGLQRGVYTINCVQFRPLTLSFIGGSSAGNTQFGSGTGGQRRLIDNKSIQLIQNQDSEEAQFEQSHKEEIDNQETKNKQEIQKSQKLNIMILICIVTILGLLLARKILTQKRHDIIYQIQDSEIELEHHKNDHEKDEVELLQ